MYRYFTTTITPAGSGLGHLDPNLAFAEKENQSSSLLAALNSRTDGVDFETILFLDSLSAALLVARGLDACN